MTRPKPVVLIAPNIHKVGDEFGDMALSVSETYQEALINSGAIPLAMAATVSEGLIAQYVALCDGLLLVGGEDVDPHIHRPDASTGEKALARITPDGGRRDLREMLLVREAVSQRKPLLAICRGIQVLNVALGGTLHLDIPTEVSGALNHRRMEQRSKVVHDVTLTEGSLIAKITGKPTLGVNSTHHQAVARVAPCLQAVAKSSDGIVEAVELKPGGVAEAAFLLGVQFHPERLVAAHAEHRAIFEAFVGACSGREMVKI
jgi:putative glutamine amidotransferase